MSQKQLITPKEFEQIFEKTGNTYENPHGVEIDLTEDVACRIRLREEFPLTLDLNADLELETFIRTFSIGSRKDLDAITIQHLWQHYKKGKGQVWASLFDETLGLSFEVAKGNTIVEGFEITYTDKITAVWDTAESFRNYIRENIQKIYIAIEESAAIRQF